jgi:hypothetical protein
MLVEGHYRIKDLGQTSRDPTFSGFSCRGGDDEGF